MLSLKNSKVRATWRSCWIDPWLTDRIWPAIDINRSGTRREEMLMDAEEHRRVFHAASRAERTEPAECDGKTGWSFGEDQDQCGIPDEPST